MASSSKKRTTMAKLNRESAVRDRRLRKQAKKDARKHAAVVNDPGQAPAADGEVAAVPVEMSEQVGDASSDADVPGQPAQSLAAAAGRLAPDAP